ncbi:MAG: hypothetical protein R2822_22345 [Spirosomataceae bacterium]
MKKLLFMCLSALHTLIAFTQNIPSEITSSRPIATGPSVVGIFEGRCPCKELAELLKVAVSNECFKTKWSLTLLQDPATKQPTTYVLEGSFYRANIRQGNWSILKGIKNDTNAVVYLLDSGNHKEPLFILKGDDNVLFILNKDRSLLVGNDLFSYTFNRVEKKPKTITD